MPHLPFSFNKYIICTINKSAVSFDLKLLGDRLLYLYCLLLAADPEIDLTWDGFVTALDDDPTVEAQFLAAVNVAEKAAAIFEAEGNKREGDKKKD